jgi:hypothetical protein
MRAQGQAKPAPAASLEPLETWNPDEQPSIPELEEADAP